MTRNTKADAFMVASRSEQANAERQAYLYGRYENGPELSDSEMRELRALINRPVRMDVSKAEFHAWGSSRNA